MAGETSEVRDGMRIARVHHETGLAFGAPILKNVDDLAIPYDDSCFSYSTRSKHTVT